MKKKNTMHKQLIAHMKESDSKLTLTIFFMVRLLIILTMIRQLMLGNYYNVFLCAMSLILIILPAFIEHKFKIRLPSAFENVVIIFVFCAEILGEINSFYINIPIWDTVLHTTTGFWAAAVGFGFIDLINSNAKRTHMSPIFAVAVAFCFSMTIAVLWEFFEFGADITMRTDMQKDYVVSSVNTTYLDETKSNLTVHINDIDKTVMYDSDGNELAVIENGYLDIGIKDTMKDMFVNMVGALVFSSFGYLYLKNSKKYRFVEKLIISSENDK